MARPAMLAQEDFVLFDDDDDHHLALHHADSPTSAAPFDSPSAHQAACPSDAAGLKTASNPDLPVPQTSWELVRGEHPEASPPRPHPGNGGEQHQQPPASAISAAHNPPAFTDYRSTDPSTLLDSPLSSPATRVEDELPGSLSARHRSPPVSRHGPSHLSHTTIASQDDEQDAGARRGGPFTPSTNSVPDLDPDSSPSTPPSGSFDPCTGSMLDLFPELFHNGASLDHSTPGPGSSSSSTDPGYSLAFHPSFAPPQRTSSARSEQEQQAEEDAAIAQVRRDLVGFDCRVLRGPLRDIKRGASPRGLQSAGADFPSVAGASSQDAQARALLFPSQSNPAYLTARPTQSSQDQPAHPVSGPHGLKRSALVRRQQSLLSEAEQAEGKSADAMDWDGPDQGCFSQAHHDRPHAGDAPSPRRIAGQGHARNASGGSATTLSAPGSPRSAALVASGASSGAPGTPSPTSFMSLSPASQPPSQPISGPSSLPSPLRSKNRGDDQDRLTVSPKETFRDFDEVERKVAGSHSPSFSSSSRSGATTPTLPSLFAPLPPSGVAHALHRHGSDLSAKPSPLRTSTVPSPNVATPARRPPPRPPSSSSSSSQLQLGQLNTAPLASSSGHARPGPPHFDAGLFARHPYELPPGQGILDSLSGGQPGGPEEKDRSAASLLDRTGASQGRAEAQGERGDGPAATEESPTLATPSPCSSLFSPSDSMSTSTEDEDEMPFVPRSQALGLDPTQKEAYPFPDARTIAERGLESPTRHAPGKRDDKPTGTGTGTPGSRPRTPMAQSPVCPAHALTGTSRTAAALPAAAAQSGQATTTTTAGGVLFPYGHPLAAQQAARVRGPTFVPLGSSSSSSDEEVEWGGENDEEEEEEEEEASAGEEGEGQQKASSRRRGGGGRSQWWGAKTTPGQGRSAALRASSDEDEEEEEEEEETRRPRRPHVGGKGVWRGQTAEERYETPRRSRAVRDAEEEEEEEDRYTFSSSGEKDSGTEGDVGSDWEDADAAMVGDVLGQEPNKRRRKGRRAHAKPRSKVVTPTVAGTPRSVTPPTRKTGPPTRRNPGASPSLVPGLDIAAGSQGTRGGTDGGGGGARTQQHSVTHCDFVSPVTGQRCRIVFQRPYDLARHRETIHAREESQLLRENKIKLEDCQVLGKEVDADKALEKAVEWRCEGKNGCGSVFSRKDALQRHRRLKHAGK